MKLSDRATLASRWMFRNVKELQACWVHGAWSIWKGYNYHLKTQSLDDRALIELAKSYGYKEESA